MPWRFALLAILESLPPLDFFTYQIHMPLPRNGLWDPPPPPPCPVPPLPPPAAAPPAGMTSAATISPVAIRPAGIRRARRSRRREGVDARGRHLPAGHRLVLGARISTKTPARAT